VGCRRSPLRLQQTARLCRLAPAASAGRAPREPRVMRAACRHLLTADLRLLSDHSVDALAIIRYTFHLVLPAAAALAIRASPLPARARHASGRLRVHLGIDPIMRRGIVLALLPRHLPWHELRRHLRAGRQPPGCSSDRLRRTRKDVGTPPKARCTRRRPHIPALTQDAPASVARRTVPPPTRPAAAGRAGCGA